MSGITQPPRGTTSFTVADLPRPSAIGNRAYVTDAAPPTVYAKALAPGDGGGSIIVPVFYNGTDWIIS